MEELPGGAPAPAPALPLVRQGSSIYSLTFDEFHSSLPPASAAKDCGSMNIDELLRTIWTAEESNSLAAAAPAPPDAPSFFRQLSITLPRTLSHRTVDDVWREIMCPASDPKPGPANPPAPALSPDHRKPTLGEMTLEEFLVKAGIVREDVQIRPKPLPIGNKNGMLPMASMPPPPAVAPALPVGSAGTRMAIFPSVVGMSAGGSVPDSPALRPTGVDPSARANGDVVLPPPVPYAFSPGMRTAKTAVVEKVAERRHRRMIKNRESAARSRQRKQAYIMELEAEVEKLKEANELLQKRQAEMIEQKKQEIVERAAEQQLGPKRACLRRTFTGPW